MHASEKRALLAMLNTIEVLVVQVRQLVSASHFEAEEKVMTKISNKLKEEVTYLSDDEDAELERRIEADRQALIADSERSIQRAWSDKAAGHFTHED